LKPLVDAACWGVAHAWQASPDAGGWSHRRGFGDAPGLAAREDRAACVHRGQIHDAGRGAALMDSTRDWIASDRLFPDL